VDLKEYMAMVMAKRITAPPMRYDFFIFFNP
jgi:hypothetical protein